MSTIKHTNGSAVYLRVKHSIKLEVEAKYIIPTGQPCLYLDNQLKPFVQEPNSKPIYCKLK